MSYHELSQAMANECSQLAFDYHPDCYCAFHFVHNDYPPRAKYHPHAAKQLQAVVWRATPPGEYDRFVVGRQADTGPELLRHLRQALADLTAGTLTDPSLPPPAPPAPPPAPPRPEPLRPPAGHGWIPTAPQTTQPLNCWPHRA